ncbi:MAG: SpoIIE family protein phosphatase [Acaryochloridaceae cyanobacterium RU_4_10]|nr:SpoIIE family protein phosphatase [Acaryochloridaceae cyanobacterium RU_4_10]
MQQALPVIYCPNLKCRTANREGDRLCKQCGTSLPQRYLWVVGTDSTAYPAGNPLLDRYLFRGPQVVIDTQPGIPLASSFDITDDIQPYLKLFPFRLHLPQVYSLLTVESPTGSVPLVLLEGVPLAPGDFFQTDASEESSFQSIAVAEVFADAWKKSLPLRQVNWLWQMAQLWTPLKQEGVAMSLVNPNLLRVEGPLLRLLSLELDAGKSPSLADLGRFWAKWCLPHLDRWRPRFGDLCDRMMEGQFKTIDPLLDELEAWLKAVRVSHPITMDIATRTDSGPIREHNEDACFPPHGTVTQNLTQGLAIVCDGVGGHAGGEVASAIAISVLTAHLQYMPLEEMTPEGIMLELSTAVGLANDLISQQNDQENRHDRDRMGTTVVMALAKEHDLYLSNLGDSRAYMITEKGCYQLTTDDDIATREVRLGYLPYREALRQPGAGSLIQALGMVPSSMLRPSTLRVLLDSDCLILLCSDGLSDFERVDTLWREDLLPLLSGQSDLAETSKTLIELANRLNGHDNVTIGLVHCHVNRESQAPTTVTAVVDRTSQEKPLPKTQIVHRPPKKSSPASPSKASGKKWRFWPWLLGVSALCGIGGAVAMWVQTQKTGVSSTPTPSVPAPSESLSPTVSGTYWKVQFPPSGTVSSPAPEPKPVLMLSAIASPEAQKLGALKEGMVLKKLEVSPTQTQSQWIQVQVCHSPRPDAPKLKGNLVSPSPDPDLPTKAPTKVLSLKSGDRGFIQDDARFKAVVVESTDLNERSLEGCAPAEPPAP